MAPRKSGGRVQDIVKLVPRASAVRRGPAFCGEQITRRDHADDLAVVVDRG